MCFCECVPGNFSTVCVSASFSVFCLVEVKSLLIMRFLLLGVFGCLGVGISKDFPCALLASPRSNCGVFCAPPICLQVIASLIVLAYVSPSLCAFLLGGVRFRV